MFDLKSLVCQFNWCLKQNGTNKQKNNKTQFNFVFFVFKRKCNQKNHSNRFFWFYPCDQVQKKKNHFLHLKTGQFEPEHNIRVKTSNKHYPS